MLQRTSKILQLVFQLGRARQFWQFIYLSLSRPPQTSRFFCRRQKIFTCRLVCGEFRQVCDKIGACRAISDCGRSRNVLSGLVGQCEVDEDNLSELARTSTNAELSRESREQASFHEDRLGPKTVSHDKKTASVRQADVPTNFNPI